MASTLQIDRSMQPRKAGTKQPRIDPKLKQFLDRTVVPILVREYLSIVEDEKLVAPDSDRMALCNAKANAPHVEVAQ